jgi:small-conductance mechanosensitive channel
MVGYIIVMLMFLFVFSMTFGILLAKLTWTPPK